MYLTICGRQILSEDIKDIRITDSRILVNMEDDFLNARYTDEEEIKDARNWLKMKSISENELQDAMTILTIVCDNFINSYTQCQGCPLHRNEICIISTIPVNWQEGEENAAIYSEDK